MLKDPAQLFLNAVSDLPQLYVVPLILPSIYQPVMLVHVASGDREPKTPGLRLASVFRQVRAETGSIFLASLDAHGLQYVGR